MATTTGVFLPDEQEQQLPKKPPQSVRPNGHGSAATESTVQGDTEVPNLSEQELKAAIKSTWKKHEARVKAELAPLLYWLREKLRAQGARNDLTQDKDRGFAFWVEEHLDISRRTVDRWCDWYAVKMGYKQDSTSGHLSKSDLELYEDILDTHKGKLQIAFNCWVPKAMHAQYQKALTTLQEKFGAKDKKEALVRGVIYAAAVITTASKTGGGRKRISPRRIGRLASSRNGRRTSVGATANPSRKNAQ